MSKAKAVTVSDEAIALAQAIDDARNAQKSALDSWIPVYAAAAALVGSTTARDLAAQLSAVGARCNKDTAHDYADAYPLSEYMAREDDRDDTEWMRAAVAANQSAFLLPHECVSYARVYGGMTRAAIRDLIADAVAAHEDKGDTAITKAIKALRTKAPKKREVVPPVPPVVDDETVTDETITDETDDAPGSDDVAAQLRAARPMIRKARTLLESGAALPDLAEWQGFKADVRALLDTVKALDEAIRRSA